MQNQFVVAVLAGLLLVVVEAVPLEGLTEPELRIVGGFPALAASTKHQVSIRRRSSDEVSFGSGHFCGGSLINNRTVLTAAHCLVDGSDKKRPANFFRVVGGHTNRLQQTQTTEIRNVNRVVIHEKYNPKNFEHDVGLLILTEPISGTSFALQPISMTTVRPNTMVRCQTSGWGTTQYGLNAATIELMAVNVTVQPTELCNGTTSYSGQIRPGQFCVGEVQGGRDACQGDSGGPLVCDGLLAGIVSNGYRCAEPGYPGIYADVAYYRDWIQRNGATTGRMAGVSLVLAAVLILTTVTDRW